MFPNSFLAAIVVYLVMFVAFMSTFVFPATGFGLWNYTFFWLMFASIILPLIAIIIYVEGRNTPFVRRHQLMMRVIVYLFVALSIFMTGFLVILLF